LRNRLMQRLETGQTSLGVVGLGYVGLPLAVHFSRHFATIGYDLNVQKIARLRAGHDDTGEVDEAELMQTGLTLVDEPGRLSECGVIIVAVPSPVDSAKKPDLRALIGASETVGRHMSPGTIVVFESTVYPGLTEELCVPVLEQHSKMRTGHDFFVGYSPERINPGDRKHTLDKIVKIVAAQDRATTDVLAQLYEKVVTAGVYRARDIKTAEAAKVIENTQRDLNIALMNELAIIFNRLGLDTRSILDAAGTKWNFLPFSPGLVGGHCIGVDPYYLTSVAEQAGYYPQVILAGRRINDGMGKYVAEQAVKQMIKAGSAIAGSRILVMGLSFKENVPDLRNSKVIDIIEELREYGADVWVHDPLVENGDARATYGVELRQWDDCCDIDCVILAVKHEPFLNMGVETIRARCTQRPVMIDVRSALDPEGCEREGFTYWRL